MCHGQVAPHKPDPSVFSPTCLVAFAREPARIQHLLFILLVYHAALAQVGGELGRVQGAGQLVPCALDLLPDGIFFLLLLREAAGLERGILQGWRDKRRESLSGGGARGERYGGMSQGMILQMIQSCAQDSGTSEVIL